MKPEHPSATYAPGQKESATAGDPKALSGDSAQLSGIEDRQPLSTSQATSSVENWNRIPAELRALKRWAVSTGKPNAKGYPDKAPRDPKTGRRIDHTDPATLVTFEEARDSGYPLIGLSLHHGDGFTVIDLDDKEDNPASPEDHEVFRRIVQHFDSYTEASSSGRGAHVIVRGTMPEAGKRRDHIEAYSSQRYIICTGNSIGAPKPIAERPELLATLYAEISGGSTPAGELVDGHSFMTDAEIIDMGRRAANGAKFRRLHDDGDFSAYPSQSEADLALLSLLAYYSNDNEQVRRIFRASPLGQREKAQRDKYLNDAIRKCRAQRPSAAIDRDSFMAGNAKPARKPKARSKAFSFTRIDRMNVEPVCFAIDGWLAQESTAAIIGKSGAGKSFLAIDWSLSIASGRAWWGREVKQGPVFYIAGEGSRGIRKRCEACSRYHSVPLEGLPFYLAGHMPALNDPDSAQVIIDAVNDLAEECKQSPALIVIDTLARALHGESDNDAKAMNGFVACMDTLREEWGAAVLAVHHTGNENFDRPRGHSSFSAALDSWYVMTANGYGLPTQLVSKKEKDWPNPGQLSLLLKEVAFDDSGSCVIVNADGVLAQQLMAGDAKRHEVVQLRMDGRKLREIVDATGVPRSTVSRWIHEANLGGDHE